MSNSLPKKRKQRVWEEDEYLHKLSMIIERDYFPEKQKLFALRALLEAEDSNDSQGISKSKARLEQSRNFSNESLNEFLSSNTSQDNTSFFKIHTQDLLDFKNKHWWAFASEALQTHQLLAIEPPKDLGEKPSSLMFSSELAVANPAFKKPSRQVVAANTRIADFTLTKNSNFKLQGLSEKEKLAFSLSEKLKQSKRAPRSSSRKNSIFGTSSKKSKSSYLFPVINEP